MRRSGVTAQETYGVVVSLVLSSWADKIMDEGDDSETCVITIQSNSVGGLSTPQAETSVEKGKKSGFHTLDGE